MEAVIATYAMRSAKGDQMKLLENQCTRYRVPIISGVLSGAGQKILTPYQRVLRGLNLFQTLFGLSALAFMLIVPGIRSQITQKTGVETVMFMLFESYSWILIGVGNSTIPVNYIAMFFLKCFIFYDAQYSKLLLLENWKGGTGFMSTMAACFGLIWKANANYFELFQYAVPVILVPFAILLIDINTEKFEGITVVGNTVGATVSAALLLSSMGTPRWLDKTAWKLGHFRFALFWAYLTAVLTFCNVIFLAQRALKTYREELRPPSRFFRTFSETMIWFLSVYIVLLYMPAIHPGFTWAKVFPLDLSLSYLLGLFLPTGLKEIGGSYWTVIQGSTVLTWTRALTTGELYANFLLADWKEEGSVNKFNFTRRGWVQA